MTLSSASWNKTWILNIATSLAMTQWKTTDPWRGNLYLIHTQGEQLLSKIFKNSVFIVLCYIRLSEWRDMLYAEHILPSQPCKIFLFLYTSLIRMQLVKKKINPKYLSKNKTKYKAKDPGRTSYYEKKVEENKSTVRWIFHERNWWFPRRKAVGERKQRLTELSTDLGGLEEKFKYRVLQDSHILMKSGSCLWGREV